MTAENRSLLAHLVLKHGAHAEVFATESLGYLLTSSEACRQALATTLAAIGVTIPPVLVYRTEDGGAQGKPDVVGIVAPDTRTLILEGKFWASLTAHQPVSYLQSLAAGGTLVVVAPLVRFPTLWIELHRRCVEAAFTVRAQQTAGSARVARINDQWNLALISWGDLLSSLHAELQQAGEQRVAGDVEQLMSLCAQMDTSAFIPLSADDISRPSPRHISQFAQLVDDLAAYGIEHNVLSPFGPDGGKYKPGASKGRYIRYVGAVDLHELQLGIIFDSAYWSTLQETPLWLEVAVPRGCRLQSLEREQPPRVFYEGFNERPLVPLILPLQAEKHDVIANLLEQVRGVLRIVPETVVAEAESMEPSVAPV
jgi:hypothetical protein